MRSTSLAFVGALMASSAFAEPPSMQLGLGFRPPNAEEQSWLDHNQLITDRVAPNRLALERLNAERSARGLRPLAVPVAQAGDEIFGHFRAQPAKLADPVPLALPASVDNSATIWFPPIRSQGSIGSCVAFSQGYYTFTYLVAQALNRNVKDNGVNTDKFSPKFIYNLSNGGADNGMWSAAPVLKAFGAPTWAVWPYDADYKGMPRTAPVWRNALNYRVELTGTLPRLSDESLIGNMKQLLANGTLLNFTTNITQHRYVSLSNDPATSADDSTVGQPSVVSQNTAADNHAMTLVGYNDEAWTDINGNGTVETGEKGAFKIANSWGTSWGAAGFAWVSYDAVRATSQVSGGPTPRRNAVNNVVWMRLRSLASTPALLAEVTVTAGSRHQLGVWLAAESTSVTQPLKPTFVSSWSVGAVNVGALGFDGTTNAVDATLVFDFTPLVVDHAPHRWFANITDSVAPYPTTLTSFRLTDATGGLLAASSGTTPTGGLPQTTDGAKVIAWADYQLPASVNVPPVVSPGGSFWSSATIGVPFTFTFAADAFVDADADALVWSASEVAPGLTFAPSTRTLSGTPTQLGYFTGYVAVDDGHGHVVNAPFSVNVSPVSTNVAPILVTPLPNQTTSVGANYSYTLPEGTFVDADGDRLTWSGRELPAWLTLDGGVRGDSTGGGGPDNGGAPVTTLSGTPTVPEIRTVMVAVDDGHKHSVSTSFTLTVTASSTNGAPVVTTPIADRTAIVGQALSFALPEGTFTDPDNDPLVWLASGLPAGLRFDPSTRVISGTPTTVEAATVTVLADDGHGHSTSTTFTLSVGAGNVAPVVASPVPNQNGTRDEPFSYVISTGTFSDADGDVLVWSVTGLPTGLSFEAGTRTIRGTPTALDVTVVTVTVSDGHGHSTSTTFTLTVSAPNVGPTVNGTLADASAEVGRLFTTALPSETFVDADGDSLTWSVSGLPPGLSFEPLGRTVSGTPTSEGVFTVTVAVDDGHGHVVSTTFTFTVRVTRANAAPVLAAALTAQHASVGTPFTYAVPPETFTDAEGEVLMWSASGLPSWLTFDPASHVFSGMPTDAGEQRITVSVVDPAQGRAEASFALTTELEPEPESGGAGDGGGVRGGCTSASGAPATGALLAAGLLALARRRRSKLSSLEAAAAA